MWVLAHKKMLSAKELMLRTVVLEKTLESPMDSKELQPVNPKGNQPWIFTGRTDVKLKLLILWPPDTNSQLIEKDPDAGKDWGHEEKETMEDHTVGWHHQLNEHELEQTQGDSEGEGSLVCCSPWESKSWTQLSDWTTINSCFNLIFLTSKNFCNDKL